MFVSVREGGREGGRGRGRGKEGGNKQNYVVPPIGMGSLVAMERDAGRQRYFGLDEHVKIMYYVVATCTCRRFLKICSEIICCILCTICPPLHICSPGGIFVYRWLRGCPGQ